MKNTLPFSTLSFKVTLRDSDPAIWRRILIPEGFNFYQLHIALQAAFGWENYHLFEFTKTRSFGIDSIGIPDDENNARDARKVSLKKIFKKIGDSYGYIYDFGDYWQHDIELEAITTEEVHTAVCVEGENECPPEDCGGVHGYLEMIQTFKTGTAAEKKDFQDWLGLSPKKDWDPGYYNQREVNKRMALLAPDNLTFRD
ncbi:MAG: plasmid pRiA4b ORF-3 family protein [Chitinophagaceae bacterium]